MTRRFCHQFKCAVGDTEPDTMARRKIARFGTGAECVGRRMWLTLRARPDRYRPILEVTALPAEGLRLGPRLEDQFHPLVGAFARLLWIEVVAQIFIGRSAEHPDHDAPWR